MKVSELLSVYDAFRALSEKELPFSAALTVAENMEGLKTAYDVAKKKENSILQSALVLDENGNPISVGENTYKIKPGTNPQAEITSLMEEEVEIPELKKIAKKDIEGNTIKPNTILALKSYLL